MLKPSHVTYRLQNQYFALGDRVTMVQDSVLLSVKGVVVGLNAKSMDVVWDVPLVWYHAGKSVCFEFLDSLNLYTEI